jgi:hypothetical protein
MYHKALEILCISQRPTVFVELSEFSQYISYVDIYNNFQYYAINSVWLPVDGLLKMSSITWSFDYLVSYPMIGKSYRTTVNFALHHILTASEGVLAIKPLIHDLQTFKLEKILYRSELSSS